MSFPVQATPADPWSPLAAQRGGMPVAVRWGERLWLHAVALSADDQNCEMLLGDGTTTRVSRGSIVAIPTGSPFQVGHTVLARWRNSAMFPGTISAASEYGYTVAWHDGDAPIVVPAGSLTFLDWCRDARPVIEEAPRVYRSPYGGEPIGPPSVPKPTIAPGVMIGLYTGKSFLIARVKGLSPGGYAVELPDGTHTNIAAADAIPIPGDYGFQVGDQVLAHWKNGFMFPGTISQVSSAGYTVAWHDGDQPLIVQQGTLTFLYWALERTA